MTKAEAIAAIESFKKLKGKSIIKKDSADTSKYTIKEVVALPFGQKITDGKKLTDPKNFTGHDWFVYVIMEPHPNFFVKVEASGLEKTYRVV